MAELLDPRRRSFLLGKSLLENELSESLSVVIADSCFALRGIACMSCCDVCAIGALRFEVAFGGARPRIETESCTRCGDCAQACPADAIQLRATEVAS